MGTFRGHILTPLARGWADWPDGRLDVERGRIISVGPWRREKWRATQARTYADLRPHILFPGLVDTHAHVPQLAACGLGSDGLLRWLRRRIYPMEAGFHGERARKLSRAFVREMLSHGTTTAALYTSAWPDSTEACFRAAEEARIHAWIGPPLMDLGAYRKVTTRQVLREARELARLDRPRIRFAVTPRFALSSTRELLEGAADLAREKGLPIQTHLAEQREECAQVQRRFGCGYLEVYERAGLVGPRTLFAHAVWLTPRQWERVGTVAHCPTSNVFLGSGVMDWRRARRARVGLGSDVGAGPDLCIFRVARTAWTVHSMSGIRVRAAELLRAATLDGARALGFDETGSLEKGKMADFIVLDAGRIVPPGAPAVESTQDLLSRILHRAGRSSIQKVYVSGVLTAKESPSHGA